MATNPVAITPKPSAFENELSQYEPQLRAALPNHIPVERFKRTFVTAINSNPDLMQCERRSLFTALVRCAQDGLLPDGREAALVPFKGRVSYLPMVAGVIKRMRNSAELLAISAHVVYENDRFSFALGDDEKIEHVPALANPGNPIGAYAIARLKSGEVQREFMSLEQIKKVRAASRATSGPWFDWWDQMARKSVIKRIAKFLPMNAELADFLDRDDKIDLGAAVDRPQSRLAAVISEPEQPEPAQNGAGNEQPDQERPTDPPHDPSTGEIWTAPIIPVPPQDATVKAWGNYTGLLIEAIKAVPGRSHLAIFEMENTPGIETLLADFPPSHKRVRDAITARLAQFVDAEQAAE